MKKKLMAVVCAACLVAGLLAGCGKGGQVAGNTAGSEDSADSSPDRNMISQEALDQAEEDNMTIPNPEDMDWPDATTGAYGQEDIPTYYLEGSWQETSNAQFQGSIVTLDYVSAMTSTSGDAETKTATIYLPYGYTPDKQYDVLYLMHGMGGSDTTFLGENGSYDGGMKKVLDYAIMEGKIKPMIVVAPDLGDVSIYDENRLDALCLEIRTILMPLVESTYSTYAQTTDHDGLVASRDHRAFGGFSMGGCITWRMLWNYTEYFRYYIPCSMIVDFDMNADVTGETHNMVDKLKGDGWTWKDYSVYCATSTNDYTSGMVNTQVKELEKYPDQFKPAENNFDEGNLMFRVWKGRGHRFYQSFDYFYSALMLFFPGDGTNLSSGGSQN